MTSPIVAVMGAALGACLGSFATTAALRSTRGEQAWLGRSHCDACGSSLTYLQTAPVVSFISLRGSCTSCGARIDPIHLAGEGIGAAVVGLGFLALAPLQASVVTAVGLALLVASVVDGKLRRLPDPMTLIVAVCSVALTVLSGRRSTLVGLAAGALTFLVLEACRRAFTAAKGRSGLGFGDVKLASALALWLGAATPWMIIAAAFGGLAYCVLARPRDPLIPFGPFIAVSAWIIGFAREAHWWPSQT